MNTKEDLTNSEKLRLYLKRKAYKTQRESMIIRLRSLIDYAVNEFGLDNVSDEGVALFNYLTSHSDMQDKLKGQGHDSAK